MENLNVEQLAHLNPDTESAAFEQVCGILYFNLPRESVVRARGEKTPGGGHVCIMHY